MFEIYDGRTHFWQWDLDCKLIVEDASIKQVHFCNGSSECSLVCLVYEENGQFLVNVPNILLQSDRDIHAYAYDGVTKYEACLKVYARCKPADYVYTETEVATWEQLNDRLTTLEQGGVSEEVLAGAIQDYFVKNPIETGATAEQAAQIEANKQAISDIQNAGYITTVPDEYVTDTELNAKGYATTDDVATAVSDKVTMEDVHNATSGFVSQAYVDEKIAAIPEPDLSGYALKTEIPDVSGFITEIPAEYITESELNAKGYLTEHQDLSGYALKTEIPDVSAYQTAEQVQTIVNNAIASITDGEAVSY